MIVAIATIFEIFYILYYTEGADTIYRMHGREEAAWNTERWRCSRESLTVRWRP